MRPIQLRTKVTLILLLLTILPIGQLAASPSENSTLFDSGVAYFKEGSYDKAISTYANLLKSGERAPEIFHNLGLAHYYKGEKGWALAYFRELAQSQPRNRSLVKTIDHIESQLAQKDFDRERGIGEDINSIILRWFLLPEMLLLHLSSLAYFGVLVVWRMAKRRRNVNIEERTALLTPGLYVGLFFLVSLTLLVLMKINMEATDFATIVSKNRLILKSGPSQNAADLYDLFEGFEVVVDSEFKDWVQITYQDRITGWVKSENIWKYQK